MTTSSKKIGPYQITGHPSADWSHATAVLATWHVKDLGLYQDLSIDDPVGRDQGFRQRLMQAGGINELSEEDLALVTSLAEAHGDDISHYPGGENYKAAQATPTNPLGLPGNLWGAVGEAEDGALVSALISLSDTGDLSIMVPGQKGWEPLYDLGVIEDETLVGLMPSAIKLYQKYDRDNTLGVISTYPLSESGPFPSNDQLDVLPPKEIMPLREGDPRRKTKSADAPEEPEQEDQPEELEESVTASVVLDTEDDLPAAIAAAGEDPDLRWYVEKRVEALGLEAALPWLHD